MKANRNTPPNLGSKSVDQTDGDSMNFFDPNLQIDSLGKDTSISEDVVSEFIFTYHVAVLYTQQYLEPICKSFF